MYTHKKIYIEKLQQFEDDNNNLDAKMSGKEEIHESVITALKRQDTLLNIEQAKTVELETRADKLAADLNHIESENRLEAEITNDITLQMSISAMI